MSDHPRPPVKQEAFNFRLAGTVGVFYVKQSVPVIFFSATVQPATLGLFKTAREVLRGKLDFKKLIQREIIPGHVESIRKFLADDRESVKFLPPLIVSAIGSSKVDEENNFLEKVFDKPTLTTATSAPDCLSIQWGNNLRMTAYKSTDRLNSLSTHLLGVDSDVSIDTSSVILDVNPASTVLVILDGQHRAQAINKLNENSATKGLLSNTHIPICLIFTPTAGPSGATNASDALRAIFSQINSRHQAVSGSFTTLLDDRWLYSQVVRELCECFRRNDALWLTEWNVPIKSRSSQINDIHTKVTAVGVLASCLKSHGVKDIGAVLQRLLKTNTRIAELSSRDFDEGDLNSFEYELQESCQPIIEELVTKNLAPTLYYLFKETQPYQLRFESLNILRRRLPDMDPVIKHEVELALNGDDPNPKEKTSDVINKMLADLNSKSHDNYFERLYFTAKFQQGLVRAWLTLLKSATNHGVESSIDDLTTNFIKAINELGFSKNGYFTKTHSKLLLGPIVENEEGSVDVSAKTRNAVADLMLLIATSPKSSLYKSLEKNETAIVALRKIGQASIKSYAVAKYQSLAATSTDFEIIDQSGNSQEKAEGIRLKKIIDSISTSTSAEEMNELEIANSNLSNLAKTVAIRLHSQELSKMFSISAESELTGKRRRRKNTSSEEQNESED